MFILDEPFVSDFLRDAALRLGAPILDTPMARTVCGGSNHLCSSREFAALARTPGTRLYTNSENAIDWIADNLSDTDLPAHIDLFKDKVSFRQLTAPLFPDFVFREVALDDLQSLDPTSLPMPCVIKPAVGFFSIGVHHVPSLEAWPGTVDRLLRDVEQARDLYPERVIDLDRFIIEEVIPGDEYAFDAFFDSRGEPVVVNIMQHLFVAADDVSDRVYFTSPTLIERFLEPLTGFLRDVGALSTLRGFPLHTEVRIDPAGKITPIEINPLRFGGWCASEIAWHANRIDPYAAYLNDTRPDWSQLLPGRVGRTTALVVADFPIDVDRTKIRAVDYESFERRFSRPLELRRVDFRRFPVFAFLYVEVPENDYSELEAVLSADLTLHLTIGD
jgi:hypothetical protein